MPPFEPPSLMEMEPTEKPMAEHATEVPEPKRRGWRGGAEPQRAVDARYPVYGDGCAEGGGGQAWLRGKRHTETGSTRSFPERVTPLVPRPELGKSWLQQQVGSSVALGNSVLVNPIEPDKPAHGDVLCLNLGGRREPGAAAHDQILRGSTADLAGVHALAWSWRRLDRGRSRGSAQWSRPQRNTLL